MYIKILIRVTIIIFYLFNAHSFAQNDKKLLADEIEYLKVYSSKINKSGHEYIDSVNINIEDVRYSLSKMIYIHDDSFIPLYKTTKKRIEIGLSTGKIINEFIDKKNFYDKTNGKIFFINDNGSWTTFRYRVHEFQKDTFINNFTESINENDILFNKKREDALSFLFTNMTNNDIKKFKESKSPILNIISFIVTVERLISKSNIENKANKEITKIVLNEIKRNIDKPELKVIYKKFGNNSISLAEFYLRYFNYGMYNSYIKINKKKTNRFLKKIKRKEKSNYS